MNFDTAVLHFLVKLAADLKAFLAPFKMAIDLGFFVSLSIGVAILAVQGLMLVFQAVKALLWNIKFYSSEFPFYTLLTCSLFFSFVLGAIRYLINL